MEITNTVSENNWGAYSTQAHPLKHEHKADFFETAPEGTVVEVWEDLYKRVRNSWVHLEDLVFSETYSEYREHDKSTAEQMVSMTKSEYTTVYIVRLKAAEN